MPAPDLKGANVEVLRAAARTNTSQQKEMHAVQTEIYARQWAKVVEVDPALHNAAQQAPAMREQAKAARAEANSMHALAKMQPGDHKSAVLVALEHLRQSFVQQYVTAIDAAENPDAYGNATVPVPVAEAAIEALDEVVQEVKQL